MAIFEFKDEPFAIRPEPMAEIAKPIITRADFTNQPNPRLPNNRQIATIVSQDCSRGKLTWNKLGLLLFTQV